MWLDASGIDQGPVFIDGNDIALDGLAPVAALLNLRGEGVVRNNSLSAPSARLPAGW